jgi:3,5-epimerase/4-reductase
MRLLIFGKGWLAQEFTKHTKHEVMFATSRADDYASAKHEIELSGADSVLSFIGRTHGTLDDGTHISTIDYLEHAGKLTENLRDNLTAPLYLAHICQSLAKHFVYLGTGCIYNYTAEQTTFSETDLPNFFGSSYSIVKGWTNNLMISLFPNALHLRIRMPISTSPSPRNLIDKLISYPKIQSIPNSMTVIDEMWPILDNMIDKKTIGTYNMCNPCVVDHTFILAHYKRLCDPRHTWTEEPVLDHLKAARSNNHLSTHKIEDYCRSHGLHLSDIQAAVVETLVSRHKSLE